jgi:hypothetical protein
MTCAKCGASYINGPIHRFDGQREYLEYNCLTCRYSWDTPTKDAEPNPFAGLPDRLQPRGGSQ